MSVVRAITYSAGERPSSSAEHELATVLMGVTMRLALLVCAAALFGASAAGQPRTGSYELLVHWSDIHQSTEYTRIYPTRDQCERAKSAVIAEQHRKLVFEEKGSAVRHGTVTVPYGAIAIVPGTSPFTVCIPVP